MEKNYKFGFSYIELVFAMAIVVILLAISAPFLTRRNYSSTGASYGEYQCWAVYDDVDGKWRLKERSRYNTEDFDNLEGKFVNECRFLKPIGVNEYEVTLVSGGGGGSTVEFPNEFFVSNCTDGTLDTCYIDSLIQYKDEKKDKTEGSTLVKRSFVLKYLPSNGGEAGKFITFRSTLKGAFDVTEDNEIKINLCNTNPEDNYDTKLKNNKHCIGKGGDGAEYKLGGEPESDRYKPLTKEQYFNILKVYDDRLAKEYGGPASGEFYFGTGGGEFTSQTNVEILQGLCGVDVVSCSGFFAPVTIENIGHMSIAQVKQYLDAAKSLRTESYENTGSNGDYTRFITGDKTDNLYCTAGNCIVPGGEFGKTKAETSDSFYSMDMVNDCEKKDGWYYCTDKRFSLQAQGKYNSKFTEKGNSMVNLEASGDGLTSEAAGYYTKFPESIISDSKKIEVKYQPLQLGYGAGGGGGNFMLASEKQPACEYIDNGGSKDYTASEISTDKRCLSEKVSEYYGNTFLLKRANGGRGSGGAIIIKW